MQTDSLTNLLQDEERKTAVGAKLSAVRASQSLDDQTQLAVRMFARSKTFHARATYFFT